MIALLENELYASLENRLVHILLYILIKIATIDFHFYLWYLKWEFFYIMKIKIYINISKFAWKHQNLNKYKYLIVEITLIERSDPRESRNMTLRSPFSLLLWWHFYNERKYKNLHKFDCIWILRKFLLMMWIIFLLDLIYNYYFDRILFLMII